MKQSTHVNSLFIDKSREEEEEGRGSTAQVNLARAQPQLAEPLRPNLHTHMIKYCMMSGLLKKAFYLKIYFLTSFKCLAL